MIPTGRLLRSTETPTRHTLRLLEEHERYHVYLFATEEDDLHGVLLGSGSSDTAAIMEAEERLHKLWRRTQELRRR